MALLRVDGLPDEALAAAARFHADFLPQALDLLAEASDALTLIFPPADHSHRAWRLAAVQSLAREHAPRRVNALVGDDAAAIAVAQTYLAAAPGVTGQVLPLDGHSAGVVIPYEA